MNNETMNPNTNQTTQIFAALVAAQKLAKAVEKSGENKFAKYKYATAESMIEEARGALNESGLAVVCSAYSVFMYEPRPGVETLAAPPTGKVCVNYKLVHESGESLDFYCETSTIVERGRPQDKSEATALTYNLGYFLRGLLCLPRVAEGTDVDQRDDGAAAVTAPVRTPVKTDGDAVTRVKELIDAASDEPSLMGVIEKISEAGLSKNKTVRDYFAAKQSALKGAK